ncbi:MAG: hypothetical protein WD623_02985 [Marinobacter sp.]|uniref:hypothetical protein n=1 Tax=Marinobacter sp. TaxID=50741 RepID=UPI0034A02803
MFQLIFKGECAPGTNLDAARTNARALFKASLEQVDRMFSGQPVVIRNKLDEPHAQKYRAVLRKHGMVAYVEPMAGAPAAKPESSGKAHFDPAQPRTESSVSNADSRPVERSAGDVAGLSTEPGDRLPVAGKKVDDILAGSALTLDPVGVTLMTHKEVEPPMFQHLDDWTLAPPGSELGVKRDLPPPVVPDVSHLSLQDENQKEH